MPRWCFYSAKLCEANVSYRFFGYTDVKYTLYEQSCSIALVGPRVAYDAYHATMEVLDEPMGTPYEVVPVKDAVQRAFEAIVPAHTELREILIRVQLVDVQPDWREELREIAHGRRVHNQGVDIPGREIIEWGNLRFRSQSEARIAKALDATGVLFLPNCLARLATGNGRGTREADFLVCASGKGGILEVDGPYHPRAADDHERDRLFQQHGIKVTQRFTAEECYSNAPAVVQKFPALLDRNG